MNSSDSAMQAGTSIAHSTTLTHLSPTNNKTPNPTPPITNPTTQKTPNTTQPKVKH
jgi:hypothetical protein